MHFNDTDKNNILHFLQIVSKSDFNGLSREDDLWELTDVDTKELIHKILALNPAEYGFRGKQLPKVPVPADVITIENQTHNLSGEYKLGHKIYLPKSISNAFSAMAEAFHEDNPNRQLLIGSGYRSHAYQTVTLLYLLVKVYDFDLCQTLKRVALPDYSQHCLVSETAIDVLNIDGEPSDENPQKFADSVEYTWLTKHAHRFSFRESYPKNNPDGIMWEPWHWQFLD